MNLIVIAKAPLAGRSKTRLCPPRTPEEAALIAEAALADTLGVVIDASRRLGARPVLVLDGDAGPWLPGGVRVVPQRGDGLDERLAAAFDDVGGPAFLVGMDTPQITIEVVVDAVERLLAPGVDAVLGPAADGGWWAIGLRHADRRVFVGVTMSTATTCREQRERLGSLGLAIAELGVMRDVDVFDDALAVAAEAPGTRFATAVASVTQAQVSGA